MLTSVLYNVSFLTADGVVSLYSNGVEPCKRAAKTLASLALKSSTPIEICVSEVDTGRIINYLED